PRFLPYCKSGPTPRCPELHARTPDSPPPWPTFCFLVRKAESHPGSVWAPWRPEESSPHARPYRETGREHGAQRGGIPPPAAGRPLDAPERRHRADEG